MSSLSWVGRRRKLVGACSIALIAVGMGYFLLGGFLYTSSTQPSREFVQTGWKAQAYDWAARTYKFVNTQAGTAFQKLRVQLTYPFNVASYSHAVSQSDLPVLNIFLPGGAMSKLVKQRNQALAAGQIIHGDDKWMSARLLMEGAGQGAWGKIKLRLKGDLVDHVEDPLKWSFRIKSKSSIRYLGAKVFSLQHPKTRNGVYSFVLNKEARLLGVIAPRTRAVRVRVNNADVGIMMFQEHLQKEMIEEQKLREAPIVAFNEDYLWEQRKLRGLWRVKEDYNPRHYAVKLFSKSGRKAKTTQEWHAANAVGLFRGFIDGWIPAEQAFSVQKTADYLALTAAWGGWHSLFFYNQRFYYDPISRSFAPILFDAEPTFSPKEHTVPGVYGALATSEVFQKALERSITKLRRRYSNSSILKEMRSFASEISELASIDAKLYGTFNQDEACQSWGSPCVLPLNRLVANLDTFEARIKRLELKSNRVDRSGGSPLKSLIAYWVPQAGDGAGSALEIRNISSSTVEVESVSFRSKKIEKLVKLNGILSAGEAAVFPLPDINYYAKKGALDLTFKVGEKVVSKRVMRSYSALRQAVPAIDVKALAKIKGVTVDAAHQKVTIDGGSPVVIEKEIVLPLKWSVGISAGASVTFKKGGLLRVRGNIDVLGSPSKRVRVSIQSAKDKFGNELWGGLLVMQGRSRFEHVDFVGMASATFDNRQDSRGLTGCVTVYKGQANFRDVTFENLQCEDGLNIVFSPDTKITGGRFVSNGFDALDADFSQVLITSTKFESIGNDAIDVSGSVLKVVGVIVSGAGDKALSIGEKSTAEILDSTVTDAAIGVAAKDGSDATVRDVRFKSIRKEVFSAYIKKPEYGPARVSVHGGTITASATLYKSQQGSSVEIDNRRMLENEENVAHLPSMEDMILERFQTN